MVAICQRTPPKQHPECSGKLGQYNAWLYPGLCLDITTIFSGGVSHYKDKTVARPSYLYNGNSCNGKTTSLFWDDHRHRLNVKRDFSVMEFHYEDRKAVIMPILVWYLYIETPIPASLNKQVINENGFWLLKKKVYYHHRNVWKW